MPAQLLKNSKADILFKHRYFLMFKHLPEELLRECAMMLLCYDCLRHDGMLTLDRFNTGIQNQDCASS